ncbi:MAG: hypothetical protein QG629_342, partial [Patescibacteria group bacterium]|nr:hypothetical protein [Patescibacteria group bacterium]
QGLRAESIQKLTEWHKTSPIQVLFLGDTEAAETIWLNQRAVFDDMFDTNVREELKKWLRFSHKEKLAKKDGLSYDCMELSGPALRFFVKYYRIIRLPIFAQILRKYYLRTMTDKSTVLYMRAPFATEQNAFDIGTAMLKMWIEVSRQGAYLHPFGTIVSNLEAHRDFLELTHIQEENIDENYVVFICRAGYSDLPVRSERIPSTEHLIKAED